MQRTEAGAAVAECEGLLPPKYDAGTATRHYRAFWQRRCRAAAAGAVLKPSGGNCAVLPKAGPELDGPAGVAVLAFYRDCYGETQNMKSQRFWHGSHLLSEVGPTACRCVQCLLQNAALPAYCISRFSTNSQPPPYKLVRF